MILRCFYDYCSVTAQTSFFIRSDETEEQKIRQRQLLLQSLGRQPLPGFVTTFPFDKERAGTAHCENMIGSVSLPVGVAGPLSMQMQIDTIVQHIPNVVFPLATTEGALVASINRGVRLMQEAEKLEVAVKKVGMSRAPVFECRTKQKAKHFESWLLRHTDTFQEAADTTSSHTSFLSVKTWRKDTLVYARCVFDTGEAMGMNMVSIALAHWWESCVPASVKKDIRLVALSSNLCADKKPAAINRQLGRGHWVAVEAVFSHSTWFKLLRVSVQDTMAAHEAKNVVGSQLAGTPAGNMQVANAAAAFFLATGQDCAHVVDVASAAAVSFVDTGTHIVVSLDLPTVPVGSVGGGTALAPQQAWLAVVTGKKIAAAVLAGCFGVVALAGEISGLAALANNTLSVAHKRLGRNNDSSLRAK